MMKKFSLIKLLIIYSFLTSNSIALQSSYLNDGIKLFNKKKYTESKFFFEQDLVFNPKSEKSYLYLAKIFNKTNNEDEQEINLNNVLLINPQNDEALYMLILLKIKQSDYLEAKKFINQFNLICKTFCSKKNEIDIKFKKLTPENEEFEN